MDGRCYRIWSEGHWVHIPACPAAAWIGPDACTCDWQHRREPRRNQKLRQELAAAKHEIRALRAANAWNLKILAKQQAANPFARPICGCEVEAT
jgi:hypothetical protein